MRRANQRSAQPGSAASSLLQAVPALAQALTQAPQGDRWVTAASGVELPASAAQSAQCMQVHVVLPDRRFSVEPIVRPAWADELWRDRAHLFAKSGDGRQLIWMPRSSWQVEGDGGQSLHYLLPHGFWWDRAESLRVFQSCPLTTPKRARSSLQMLAVDRATAPLCA